MVKRRTWCKQVGIGCGGLVLAVGLTASWLWQRATQLPSWYKSAQVAPQNPDQLQTQQTQQAQQAIWQQVSRQLADSRPGSSTAAKAPGQAKLTAQQVNTLLRAEMGQSQLGQHLGPAIQATHVELQPNTIQLGAVVDLRQLRPQDRQALEGSKLGKALNTLPVLPQQPLYVGLTTSPTASDRQLSLDEHTTVQIGSFSFPLSQLAERLNISPQTLLAGLNHELAPLVPMEIEQVQVQRDQLILTGSGTAW